MSFSQNTLPANGKKLDINLGRQSAAPGETAQAKSWGCAQIFPL
jgi:hypothetical protein